jgi:hypothetical protein
MHLSVVLDGLDEVLHIFGVIIRLKKRVLVVIDMLYCDDQVK